MQWGDPLRGQRIWKANWEGKTGGQAEVDWVKEDWQWTEGYADEYSKEHWRCFLVIALEDETGVQVRHETGVQVRHEQVYRCVMKVFWETGENVYNCLRSVQADKKVIAHALGVFS